MSQVASMRLILLTALTMVAFAANSLLNRAALADGLIGPSTFAAVRLAAGVAMLWLLARGRGPSSASLGARITGTLSLSAYMLGFSFAYLTLDAGIGALILFGGVQITMFAGALVAREPIPVTRWVGAAVALAGLALLVWPGAANVSLSGLALMAVAAMGWGVYSLNGRGSASPLQDTCGNFLFALPLGLIALMLVPDQTPAQLPGLVLAVISGAVTSALGYALWYSLLPTLGATRAAVSQLTVPVIAMLAGVLLLGETVELTAAVAAVLVLGGVGLSVLPVQRTSGSKAS